MSRIIAWMLTRMLLSRFLAILAGMTIFVLTLDLVSHSEAILKAHGGGAVAFAEYGMVRAPGIAAEFTVISVLLAALLVLTEISRRSELVAIWGAGMSQFRILLALLPAAILLGGFNFWLADRAVPWAVPALYDWGVGDYSPGELKVSENDPIWLRSGNDILRARSSNADSSRLTGVYVFRRDSGGVLVEQIVAREAILTEQRRWRLSDVVIFYRDDQPPNRLKEMIYSGKMRPAAAGQRSGNPDEMSFNDLTLFIKNAGFGIRPAYVYSTWLNKRLTLVLSPLMMLLIAVPLAHRFRRGGGLGILFAIGVAMGFAFFIFDGISLTMGELGIMPPWLAAWTPVLLLVGTGGTIAFRQETL